jgi:hypothetical protein
MGSIRTFSPVKLFIGVLVSGAEWLPAVEEHLCSQYGPVDHRSGIIPFTFSQYYRHETGDSIQRVFFSFERLVWAEELGAIKVRTNQLETAFASGAPVKRPVNLDPGYLENAKVVLASTKNFYHRIYLGQGIFAEVTMHFREGEFRFFPWTYPDYQSEDYQKFFLEIRRLYREQLRTLCLLQRADA